MLFLAVVQAPFILKVIVTSRPDPYISSILNSHSRFHKCILHKDIEASVVHSDIERYLRSRLLAIPNEIGRSVPGQGIWFTETQLSQLVQQCGILFIYAYTATCIIGDRGMWDPERQLRVLLEKGWSASSTPFESLDSLYRTIIDAAFESTDKFVVIDRFQRVIGTLVLQHDALPIGSMAVILDMPEGDILAALHSLQSLISMDKDIPYIHHESFRDFITNQNRSAHPGQDSHPGYISKPKHEKRLVMRSFELMRISLQSRTTQASEATNSTSRHLAYCCRHWSSHLCAVKDPDREIIKLLDSFLSSLFLRWLEVMSTLKRVADGVTAIRETELWAKRIPCSDGILEILHDAHRFILTFLTPLSIGPQMVHDSALLFCPRKTRLWRIYKDRLSKVRMVAGYPVQWSPCLSTMYGHDGPVTTVVFSPDGSRLASGSWDSTARVWDTGSGAEMAKLQGHTGGVRTVVFSPDGLRLASGSESSTVRVWDAAGGEEEIVLQAHRDGVLTVVFSPNGAQVASGLADSTILVWAAASGEMVTTLQGHAKGVLVLVFSPNGALLASGTEDPTILVWDTATGEEMAKLQGHTGRVRTVAFASDGLRLASGSGDQTARVWDAVSGREIATLRGHIGEVLSVVFSPIGSLLASGSEDHTVRVWDLMSGAEVATLRGHVSWVRALAFSPDGSRLASGCDDSTVRVWDPGSGAEFATLRGHRRWVRTVAFSPDGSRLASGSHDSTARVWDAASGTEMTLRGHSNGVQTVAVSPDGSRLASGSNDSTIRMWNVISGIEMMTLKGHTHWVLTIVFSPDGLRLASASYDSTVRVWDVMSGVEVATLRGHTSWVRAVAFSRDGARLASGSRDSTVRVWDATSGADVAMMRGHTDEVRTVVFSPDGSRLASESDDSTVQIWDTTSGAFIEESRRKFLRSWDSSNSSRLSTISDTNVSAGDHSAYVDGFGLLLVRSGSSAALPVCHILAEYRPYSNIVMSGSTVAWGCADGRILILQLISP